MSERDKFLTEAMGVKWKPELKKWAVRFDNLAFSSKTGFLTMAAVEKEETYYRENYPHSQPYIEAYTLKGVPTIDFSTWQGFGKLWEWAQEQEWWKPFNVFANNHCGYEMDIQFIEMFGSLIPNELINPDRFANAVYEFLKEMSHEERSDGIRL